MAVLVFIIVYQQIENLILSPRISQRTMDINAAVAFLAVLAFGSLFGAFGAFLALPVTASLQAIFRAYTKRYELIDSPLITIRLRRRSPRSSRRPKRSASMCCSRSASTCRVRPRGPPAVCR